MSSRFLPPFRGLLARNQIFSGLADCEQRTSDDDKVIGSGQNLAFWMAALRSAIIWVSCDKFSASDSKLSGGAARSYLGREKMTTFGQGQQAALKFR